MSDKTYIRAYCNSIMNVTFVFETKNNNFEKAKEKVDEYLNSFVELHIYCYDKNKVKVDYSELTEKERNTTIKI